MKSLPEFLAKMGLHHYSQLPKMVLILTIRSNKEREAQEITIAICGSALTFTCREGYVSFVLNSPIEFCYDSNGPEVSGDFDGVKYDSPMHIVTINMKDGLEPSISLCDYMEVFFEVGEKHISVDFEIAP